MTARDGEYDIPFPIEGRSDSFKRSAQSSSTTSDAVNMRGKDQRTKRIGGATRPATERFNPYDSSGDRVDALATVAFTEGHVTYTPFANNDTHVRWSAKTPSGNGATGLVKDEFGNRFVVDGGTVTIYNSDGVQTGTIKPALRSEQQMAAIAVDSTGAVYLGVSSGLTQNAARVLCFAKDPYLGYLEQWTFNADGYVVALDVVGARLAVAVDDDRTEKSYVVGLTVAAGADPIEEFRTAVPYPIGGMAMKADGSIAVGSLPNSDRGQDPTVGPFPTLAREFQSWTHESLTNYSDRRYCDLDPHTLEGEIGDPVTEIVDETFPRRGLFFEERSVEVAGRAITLQRYAPSGVFIYGTKLRFSTLDRTIVEEYTLVSSLTGANNEIVVSSPTLDMQAIADRINGTRATENLEPSVLVQCTNIDTTDEARFNIAALTQDPIEVSVIAATTTTGLALAMRVYSPAENRYYRPSEGQVYTTVVQKGGVFPTRAPKLALGMSGHKCISFNGRDSMLVSGTSSNISPTAKHQHLTVIPGYGINGNRDFSTNVSLFVLFRPVSTLAVSCLFGQKVSSSQTSDIPGWTRRLVMNIDSNGDVVVPGVALPGSARANRPTLALVQMTDPPSSGRVERFHAIEYAGKANTSSQTSNDGWSLVELVCNPVHGGGDYEAWFNGYPMGRAQVERTHLAWHEASLALVGPRGSNWGDDVATSGARYMVIDAGTGVRAGVYTIDTAIGDEVILTSSILDGTNTHTATLTINAAADQLSGSSVMHELASVATANATNNRIRHPNFDKLTVGQEVYFVSTGTGGFPTGWRTVTKRISPEEIEVSAVNVYGGTSFNILSDDSVQAKYRTQFREGDPIVIENAGTSGLSVYPAQYNVFIDSVPVFLDNIIQVNDGGGTPFDILGTGTVTVSLPSITARAVVNHGYPVANDSVGPTEFGLCTTVAGASAFWSGELHRVISIHGDTVDEDERQKIEGQLAWEYGAQNMLPATHPYAVAPPPPDGQTTSDWYDARKALSAYGIVTKIGNTEGDVRWVVASDNTDSGSPNNFGGLGHAVAWNADGNLYTCGQPAPITYIGDTASVRMIIDEGDTYSLAPADGAWKYTIGDEAIDTFATDLVAMDVDGYGNVYVGFNNPTYTFGPKVAYWCLSKTGTLVAAPQVPGNPATFRVRGLAVDQAKIYNDQQTRAPEVMIATDQQADENNVQSLAALDQVTNVNGIAHAIVKVAGGRVYLETTSSETLIVDANAATSPMETAPRYVSSAQSFGEVFIVDGMTAKVFNPRELTLKDWVARGQGSVPKKARIIENFAGAMFLAGFEDGHEWVMSARPDPYDFDLDPGIELPTQAWSSQLGPPGRVPGLITGFVPIFDDLALVLCDSSVWRMTGDPASPGSRFDPLSQVIGGAFGRAWAVGPDNTPFFWARHGGLYTALGGTQLERVGKHDLESEFEQIDHSKFFVRLAWNRTFDGMDIFVCPYGGVNDRPRAYFWERSTGAYWPDERFNAGHDVTDVVVLDGDQAGDREVVMGCRDGRMRRWSTTAQTDDGERIHSRVVIGPIFVDHRFETKISRILVMLEQTQGAPTLLVRTSETPAGPGPVVRRYALRPGLTAALSARARGGYIWIELASDMPWAFESLRANLQPGSYRRQRAT